MADTKRLAEAFSLTEEEFLQESMRAFLQERLRLLTAEYRSRCARFGASSLEELDLKIRQGEVTEEDVWEDFQQIDHLASQIERIRQLLEGI